MIKDQVPNKVVETDVLVIGGGLAGCLAAIKAKEHGLNVTLIEKAGIDRSGCCGPGMDHMVNLVPHGGITSLDLLKRIARWSRTYNGAVFFNMNTKYKLIERGHWVLEELERIGLPMRWYDGEHYWMPSINMGLPMIMTSLRIPWQNAKPRMARAVRKSGVNVIERTMIIDLLTNKGTVVGATAVNTRNGEFVVIKSKATVIATGHFDRLYEPETPILWKHKMIYHHCPSASSGDGWAVAYRAGAELGNMDATSWTSRILDDITISYGNFRIGDGVPMKCLTWKGKEIMNPTIRSYLELEEKGDTPVYYSLEHLPDDFHKRMEMAIADERSISFKMAEDRGFNPRRHRYELNPKPLGYMHFSGINVDEDCKLSVKGAYAAGTNAITLGGIGFGSASGLVVGDSIDAFVKGAGEPVVDEGQVESQKETALAPLRVKRGGVEPLEFEVAIRHICERYVGHFKSEGKILEGQRRLGTLRRVWLPKLSAKNYHYLLRCLEIRNILDLTELHLKACLERKETRAGFIRVDYPEEDRSLDNKCTFQRIEEGKTVLEHREMPKLKPEYEKGGN